MIVKLTLLDRQQHLFYDTIVPVFIATPDEYTQIGKCTLFKNETGDHFGTLELDREVSGDLFFYYRSLATQSGVFDFSGLDLNQNELHNRPTTRLRDMIVA